ncbi:glyoxylase-like metal-dependent hydrolase (beta-lactamase superfamily II) [Prauserella shujinwangii]|uniref:Glyoxylase-like metal-dependent hydrolase (Beta-lactamase superfamily II) n=1 Tax=Prauserella shujinwangii TaxID=1453103 RepID=A0A2T0LR06_9PSEU|nr:MBL fold metallo-hydrolase [Prauserella shujinwangii]PRX45936.1 glyoxylase-like metal-dependent hydrolase (beta-lactamase superfamily II) [Prauserella shujinwangii]
MIRIDSIDTPTLGDRSYLVSDGEVALVVDPQRDIDRVLDLARRRGVRITHVFETHIHNDYVTGGLALARATGAAYHVNAADEVSFERTPVAEGEVVEVGAVLRVRALATPGHTHNHLSYVVTAPGRPPAVFTGGSLLYGSTGRPDLLGPEHTPVLVRAQYASAHRLATELPEETEIYPTHGFGSFCSATQSGGERSTIGQEKRTNPAFTQDEQDYVEHLLAGLDAYPAYYAHMEPLNSAGPGEPDLSPPRRAAAGELRERIESGEWVVDLRTRTAFAAGHVLGSLNFGIEGSFATYLGWLLPWGTPITLLGETGEQVAEAQRELCRIGIDRIEAAATGSVRDWTGGQEPASFPVADLTDLAAVLRHRPVVVLDVRRDLEWGGGHVDGAVHIPLHELPRRLGEVPPGEVWVHCKSGYRAAIAASLLDAAGRRVVVVDDEFDTAERAGVPLVAAGAGR